MSEFGLSTEEEHQMETDAIMAAADDMKGRMITRLREIFEDQYPGVPIPADEKTIIESIYSREEE